MGKQGLNLNPLMGSLAGKPLYYCHSSKTKKVVIMQAVYHDKQNFYLFKISTLSCYLLIELMFSLSAALLDA